MLPALIAAMTVFGVQLGAPLTLPLCSAEEPQRTCQAGSMQLPYQPWLSYSMKFPLAEVPKVMNSQVAAIFVDNGEVVGIEFDTSGVSDQDLVEADLVAKFGPPTALQNPEVKNSSGASFRSVLAKWKLSDANVTFDSAIALNHGRVTVLTLHGQAMMEAFEKDRDAKRTPL